ncbi:MAG: GxxExxY protein [archaeon]|nr:GxxExxY protein [archaeon]
MNEKYTPDLIVENKVIVEIKSTLGLTEVEEAQLLNFGKKSLEVKRRIS